MYIYPLQVPFIWTTRRNHGCLHMRIFGCDGLVTPPKSESALQFRPFGDCGGGVVRTMKLSVQEVAALKSVTNQAAVDPSARGKTRDLPRNQHGHLARNVGRPRKNPAPPSAGASSSKTPTKGAKAMTATTTKSPMKAMKAMKSMKAMKAMTSKAPPPADVPVIALRMTTSTVTGIWFRARARRLITVIPLDAHTCLRGAPLSLAQIAL